jgi:hypothetical protein
MPCITRNTMTPILAAAALAFSAATSSVHAQLPYGCPGGYYYDTHFGRCVPMSYSVGPGDGTATSAPLNGSAQQLGQQYGASSRTSGPDHSKLGGSNGGETSGKTR